MITHFPLDVPENWCCVGSIHATGKRYPRRLTGREPDEEDKAAYRIFDWVLLGVVLSMDLRNGPGEENEIGDVDTSAHQLMVNQSERYLPALLAVDIPVGGVSINLSRDDWGC